jgi:hypothetical protein
MNRKQILIEKYIEPSEISYGARVIIEKWFNKHEEEHSFMGQPSTVYYTYDNREIICKFWQKKGNPHREKGMPAYIHYSGNNEIIIQEWWNNGDFIKSK